MTPAEVHTEFWIVTHCTEKHSKTKPDWGKSWIFLHWKLYSTWWYKTTNRRQGAPLFCCLVFSAQSCNHVSIRFSHNCHSSAKSVMWHTSSSAQSRSEFNLNSSDKILFQALQRPPFFKPKRQRDLFSVNEKSNGPRQTMSRRVSAESLRNVLKG